MSDLKKRDYPSLRRKGASVGGGGSFKPINTLANSNRVIAVPESDLSQKTPLEISRTRLIENTSPLGDPNRSIERAKVCRERLSGLNSRPSLAKHGSSKVDSSTIVDCMGSSIDLELQGLNTPPTTSVDLKSVRVGNRDYIRYNGRASLSLGITENGKFLCIYLEDIPKSGYIINIDTQLKSLSFALSSIIIEIKDLKETIVAAHHGIDEDIRKYFQIHPSDKVDPSKTLADSALHKLDKTVEVLEDVIDPSYIGKRDERVGDKNEAVLDDVLGRLRTRHAKKAYWDKVVQGEIPNTEVEVVNSKETESIFVDDDYVSWEVPAKFNPDLQYTFPDGKLFRVSDSDFATLYNNSWINDAVMDFCIKFDIEEAISAGVVGRNEIHAFNSFFYTKLNSKSTSNGEPQYYQNIKRWVQKLDFMTIPYLIMPVNENHHWYCCIIRGLPNLLKAALKKKTVEIDPELTEEETENESSQTVTPDMQQQDMASLDTVNKDSQEISPESSETDSQEKPKKECAEIFVFDSLGLRRDNVKNPLKSFIIDYCKDKYDVEIPKDHIRVIAARVPRQNNYNDCGIHVIYNVSKWLFNLETCESLWRKHQHAIQRSIFVAEERNNMRRFWIDKFIALHSQQQSMVSITAEKDSSDMIQESEEKNSNTRSVISGKSDRVAVADDDDDDDIIEIIEEKKIQPSPSSNDGVASRTRNSGNQGQRQKFENNFLNETYGGKNIPRHVVDTLNELLPQRTLQLEMNIRKHIQNYINDSKWIVSSEEEKKKQFVDQFWALMKESDKENRPKNKAFKIEEQVATAVSQLSITPSTFFTKKSDSCGKKLFDKDTVDFLTEKSTAKEQTQSAKTDEDQILQKEHNNNADEIIECFEIDKMKAQTSPNTEAVKNSKVAKNVVSSGITRAKDRERAEAYVLVLLAPGPLSPKRRRLE